MRTLAGRVPPQLLKFALVGVSNTLVTLAVYSALVALGVWYVAASIVGLAAGTLNGYTWNRRWTFGGDHHRARLVRYVVVTLAGMAVSTSLLVLAVEGLGIAEVPAQVLALPFVVVVTYLGNARWTFADAR